MSLGTQEQHRGRRSRSGRRSVGASPLARWASLVTVDVSDVTGGPDELVERIVADALTGFVRGQGGIDGPPPEVIPLLWELGERHACRGLEAHALDRSFHHADDAAQRGLRTLVDHEGFAIASARQELSSYIESMRRHAAEAFHRGRALLRADDGRRAALGAVLLDPAACSPSPRLLRRAGIDPEAEHVLMVAVAGELPDVVLDEVGTVVGPHAHEALVPCAELDDVLTSTAPHQVVVGPGTPVLRAAETAEPVRRAAHLLRTGVATDQRRVVPCADLLLPLLIEGLPGLTSLLATKHLGGMDDLALPRRIRDGELLLRWLERGQPLNQVARSLGVPPQTAHDRVNHLRRTLGADLDDPGQRLELILALRGALPRWRDEALLPRT